MVKVAVGLPPALAPPTVAHAPAIVSNSPKA